MPRKRDVTDIELTREDGERILQALRDLNDILTKIEKAEACGLDCSEHRRIREDLQRRLTAIKSTYFPDL